MNEKKTKTEVSRRLKVRCGCLKNDKEAYSEY